MAQHAHKKRHIFSFAEDIGHISAPRAMATLGSGMRPRPSTPFDIDSTIALTSPIQRNGTSQQQVFLKETYQSDRLPLNMVYLESLAGKHIGT